MSLSCKQPISPFDWFYFSSSLTATGLGSVVLFHRPSVPHQHLLYQVSIPTQTLEMNDELNQGKVYVAAHGKV